MRIPIGVQLGVLVTFFSLLALGVSSLAVWFTNRGFVLKFRLQRLSLTASLKAAQLASDLQLMQSKVEGLTSRIRFQSALERYNSGERDPNIWNVSIFDLQSAISSGQMGVYTIQVSVYPTNDTNTTQQVNLFNVTASDYAPIELPYKYPNGSNAYFGWGDLGHPPLLYPNLTYSDNATIYQGRRLFANSSLLLGPLQTNQSFALASITSPVLKIGSSDQILAWITVVTDFALVRGAKNSPVGLDNSGLTLVIGPTDPSNRLPPGLHYSDHETEDPPMGIDGTEVHFVLPPDRSNTTTQRHKPNPGSFKLTSYAAAATGLTKNLHELNNAGADLKARNEDGVDVAVGWATPDTNLCDWVVIVEQTREKVFVSIDNLRKVLLGCVFGSLGFIILVTVPTSWSTTRAIRQLRDSTKKSIERAHSFSMDKLQSTSSGKLRGIDGNIEEKDDTDFNKRRRWYPKFHSIRHIFRRRRNDLNVGAENGARSYIPEKVKEGKHWINDEITDLTFYFNMMTDRIELHATELEDRVKERTLQLEASTRAAESANESKTLFIANISHELKTPLHGILGMCALTLQETDLAKIRHSMDIALQSGELLNHLLTDILTFARHQGKHQLTLDERQFKLRDVGTQISAIFDNQAKETGVNLKVEFLGQYDSIGRMDTTEKKKFGPPGTGRVKDMGLFGDQQRILQILINLVGNALKFTRGGGFVEVRVRCMTTSETLSNQVEDRDSVKSAKSLKQPPLATSSIRQRSSQKDIARPGSRSERADSARISFQAMKPRPASVASTASESRDMLINAQELSFEFEIEDTGPGIPKHLKEQIFEPFVQGDVRLTKNYGGTGLGLSICSQLVKLLKGEIKVESELGQGTTFIVKLPLKFIASRPESIGAYSSKSVSRVNSIGPGITVLDAPSHQKTPEPDSPSPEQEAIKSPTFDSGAKPRLLGLSQPFFATNKPPMASPDESGNQKEQGGRKVRVLVAEDNAVNQEVVLRMLRLEDVFDVRVAKDGQEAVDCVKESMDAGTPYDLILMDVQMPKVDGRESTRMIRQIGYSAPIVALTAFSDEANKQECMESGMDYFLAKPIKRPALKHVLKRYCPPIHEEDEGQPSSSQATGTHSKKPSQAGIQTGQGLSGGKNDETSDESHVSNGAANQSVDKNLFDSEVVKSLSLLQDTGRESTSQSSAEDLQGPRDNKSDMDRPGNGAGTGEIDSSGLSDTVVNKKSKVTEDGELVDESPHGTAVRSTPEPGL